MQGNSATLARARTRKCWGRGRKVLKGAGGVSRNPRAGHSGPREGVLSGLRAPGVPSRAPSFSYLAAVCRLSPLLRSVVESRAVHSSRPDRASRCEDSRPSLKSFGSDSKFPAEDADWLSVGQGLPTWESQRGRSHAKRAVHEGVEAFQQRDDARPTNKQARCLLHVPESTHPVRPWTPSPPSVSEAKQMAISARLAAVSGL